jgi:molybdenum cofactor guanylyltransferase
MPEPTNQGVAGFILAGGKSARMGRDKALLPWRGQTLLERALRATRVVASATRIVGSKAKFEPYGTVVEDIFPERGPLGGIHAALSDCGLELNLVLAVDLPFVTPELLTYLIQRAQGSPCVAAVPRLQAGWEPLCAVYRREFAKVAEDALRKGENAIHSLLDGDDALMDIRAGIFAIDEKELAEVGFPAQMFRNINTIIDFEAYAGENGDQQTRPQP